MRVVAGRYRGHRLVAPAGRTTRPTSDRLRETVFDILAHRFGLPDVATRVLDLFAGSGALGLEALSRGAAFALFVDNAAPARAAIRGNVEALALTGVTRIFRRDATRLGPVGTMPSFHLVFVDPPYGRGLAEAALAAGIAGGWFAPGATIVVEDAADAPPPQVPGLDPLLERRVGDSALRFFNATETGPQGTNATL